MTSLPSVRNISQSLYLWFSIKLIATDLLSSTSSRFVLLNILLLPLLSVLPTAIQFMINVDLLYIHRSTSNLLDVICYF